MKSGKSLAELAAEIQRRADNKSDYIAPVAKMSLQPYETADGSPTLRTRLALDNGARAFYEIAPIAHAQLAEYAGIPKAYYDRMREHDPMLLASNVNRWFRDTPADKRMVRTLDGRVRAVLSDKFRPLENEDLAEAVLPVLLDMDLLILSCEITESRLYIKAVDKSVERDVPTGRKMGDGSHAIFDTISPAITIGNSEVGHGSLYISSGVWTKACTNLADFGARMRKYHTGARASVSDDVYALLTDDTKRKTDAAIWAQTRDLVRGAFDVARFEATAMRLGEASQEPIGAAVVETVERLSKRFVLGEGERKGILARLIEGGDLTRYGLHAAVTRHSADVEDYDRATDLERIGGQIIELPRGEWSELIKVAA
jgi:hypothetical protein